MNLHPARFKKCLPAAVFLLVFTSLSLQAAVLRNHPVSVTQPNGEKLALFASGDEYYNWLHDKADYTIIQDPDKDTMFTPRTKRPAHLLRRRRHGE